MANFSRSARSQNRCWQRGSDSAGRSRCRAAADPFPAGGSAMAERAPPRWRISREARDPKIDAGNEVRIVLVDRDVGPRQIPFQPADLRWLNEHRLDGEFLAKRALPLIAEVRR